MSEISEAAKAKAVELTNAKAGYQVWDSAEGSFALLAFAHFIQHVSDAAKGLIEADFASVDEYLAPFILPEPVDQVRAAVSAAHEAWLSGNVIENLADHVFAELAKRGLKVVDLLS